MKKKIKFNKYFAISVVFLFIIIAVSFFQFYFETFSYASDYYKIYDYCYKKENVSHEYCKPFKDEKQLKNYIVNLDPKKKFESLDTFTVTCSIIENTFFSILQYFSPIIIAIAVVGVFQSFLSSGMLENYLLRNDYKKVLKSMYKKVFKVALIVPISLVLIFLISMITTRFNFDYSNIDTALSVFRQWKYDNFFLYGFGVVLIQFFMSLFYVNISLYFCRENKNKLVAIIVSFLTFIVIDLFIYIIIYGVLLNNILRLDISSDYFNIAGYWFYLEGKIFIPLIVSIILAIVSFAFLIIRYKNKEQVVNAYEKQIS